MFILSSRRRTALPLAGMVLCAIFVLLARAGSAHAAAGDLACSGWEQSTFEPGVTATPRQAEVDASVLLGPCVSSDPTLTSGTGQLHATATLSCNSVASGAAAGVITFEWSDERTSTVAFSAIIGTHAGGQVAAVGNGSVTDGEFRGDSVAFDYTLASLTPQACLQPGGVTSVSGPINVTFS